MMFKLIIKIRLIFALQENLVGQGECSDVWQRRMILVLPLVECFGSPSTSQGGHSQHLRARPWKVSWLIIKKKKEALISYQVTNWSKDLNYQVVEAPTLLTESDLRLNILKISVRQMDDLKKHQLDTEATIFGHYKQK